MAEGVTKMTPRSWIGDVRDNGGGHLERETWKAVCGCRL